MSKVKGTPGPVRLRWKLLAAVIAPILVLGALEGFVRVAGIVPHRDPPIRILGVDVTKSLSWDENLFWRLEPGREHPREPGESISPQGFRGPAFEIPKPAGVRRVLCLGDSCTFGVDVREDATFSHRLQRWLDAGTPSARWEVVNAGVPGYTLWQMTRFFDLMAGKIDPDVVVLYAGAVNDFGRPLGGSDSAAAEQVRRSNEGLGSFRLVQLVRAWLDHVKYRRLVDQDLTEATSPGRAEEPRTSDGVRVPTDEFSALLGQLADAVRRRGARLLVLVPPAPSTTRKQSPEGEQYAEILRRTAAARDIPCIDLRSRFSADTRGDALFTDHIHPAVQGHRIIFEAVAAAISRLDVAPPAPAGPDHFESLGFQKLMEGGWSFLDGEPLKAGDLSRFSKAGNGFLTPAPCQVRFENVRVPPQASLFLDFAPRDPRPGHPEATTLRVLAGPAGSEARAILTRVFPVDRKAAQVVTCRADLAAFEGQTVTLILDVGGGAGSATWGDVSLQAYR